MNMLQKIRTRREANRRAYAINRALRTATTPAMRDEILTIAQRYYG